MYDNGDILLFALSARHKTIPWRDFTRCFDAAFALSLPAGSDNATKHRWNRWRAVRELSALGHIDLHVAQGQWQVVATPPALSALPHSGMPRAVLCGARSPSFLESLGRYAAEQGVAMRIESQSTASPFAPARIELRSEDADRIQSVAHRAGIRYLRDPAPARLLAHMSLSLSQYRQTLLWSDQPEIDWRREDFDADRLRFQSRSAAPLERRLSRYQNPVTTLWSYRLWMPGKNAEVDRDWGCYAMLGMLSRRFLQYRLETRTVSVPLRAPLPALLNRALGLCSGHCPHVAVAPPQDKVGGHLAFQGVPPSIFNAVAAKLDQAPPHYR